MLHDLRRQRSMRACIDVLRTVKMNYIVMETLGDLALFRLDQGSGDSDRWFWRRSIMRLYWPIRSRTSSSPCGSIFTMVPLLNDLSPWRTCSIGLASFSEIINTMADTVTSRTITIVIRR